MSSGRLFLVATPIGTLADCSPRAREILSEVDVVLAEDTRNARRLLSALDLPSSPRRLLRFDEHAEAKQLEPVLEMLHQGSSAALISDAGTPVLSDPGFLLVRAARAAGVEVLSVPGPSAFPSALAASGLPPLPAMLIGFLPHKAKARDEILATLASARVTGVFFISPHRGASELAAIAKGLGGETEAVLLSEISKRFERARSGRLADLAAAQDIEWRGEHALVTAAVTAVAIEATPETASELYQQGLADGLGRADAMRHAARVLGVSKREIFNFLERSQ